VDGTVIEICRPPEDEQLLYFSGHYKTHAVKYSVLTMMNGLVACAEGPKIGSMCDQGMWNSSFIHRNGFAHRLRELGLVLYADAGYTEDDILCTPFPGEPLPHTPQWEFNMRMRNTRGEVEHAIGFVKNNFRSITWKHSLKLHATLVGHWIDMAFFIANCKICLEGGNQTGERFGLDVPPWLPTVEEYLATV
jgi:hypothetical protein